MARHADIDQSSRQMLTYAYSMTQRGMMKMTWAYISSYAIVYVAVGHFFSHQNAM